MRRCRPWVFQSADIRTPIRNSTRFVRFISTNFNCAHNERSIRDDHEQDFVYGDGKLVAAESVPYMGGRRHFSLDHLGNVRLVTSDGPTPLAYGRHDYYPFGMEQTSSIQTYVNFNFYPPDPMKFAGHERDYLGVWDTENTDYLDDMHARYYNPNIGRFLSVDSSPEILSNLGEPRRWNRYAYGTNNPVRYTDPTGRDTWDKTNGFVNASGSDNLLGARRVNGPSDDYKSGQHAGDFAASVSGLVETGIGLTGDAAAAVVSLTGVGVLWHCQPLQ